VQSTRSATVAIAAFLTVPNVHQSVEWWRTLHQDATFLDDRRLLDPQIGGTMGWTLFLGVIAFTLLYCWMLAHRFRLAWLEDRLADRAMQVAIDERRAEAQPEVVS
jgi:heme exporter protein C